MPTRAHLNEALIIVEAAALKGERCPMNDEFAVWGVLTALAREGKIKIEVYAHNWRVVEILKGPHKGNRTAKCPHKNNGPYLVITTESTYRTRRWTSPKASDRQQPSAPRVLTRDEL